MNNNIYQHSPMIFQELKAILDAFHRLLIFRWIQCSMKYNLDCLFKVELQMLFLQNLGLVEHYTSWYDWHFNQLLNPIDATMNNMAFQIYA